MKGISRLLNWSSVLTMVPQAPTATKACASRACPAHRPFPCGSGFCHCQGLCALALNINKIVTKEDTIAFFISTALIIKNTFYIRKTNLHFQTEVLKSTIKFYSPSISGSAIFHIFNIFQADVQSSNHPFRK